MRKENDMTIILSPEDAELLGMSDLQLAAKVLRQGGAVELAKVCEDADARIGTLQSERDGAREVLDNFDEELADKIDSMEHDYNIEKPRDASLPGKIELLKLVLADFRRARSASKGER
jgi:hypothetical protein